LNEALLTISFNFHFWSAFIAWPTVSEHGNFRFSIRNFHQRGTSQHTANMNELHTKAVPRLCWIRILCHMWVDRWEQSLSVTN